MSSQSQFSQNRLGDAISPYLIQHKDNPVHWQVWSDDVLAHAKQAGKPILLSIGYAACHWCHVMAHESFEDEATASLMNDLFVNIKVDREQHPEIDAIYQQALAVMGQQGGWPLTMFITPDGDPFWGGTYFPPQDAHGRPGFQRVLQEVARLYHNDTPQLATNKAAIKDKLAKLGTDTTGQALNPAMLDMIAKRLCREIDPFHGGLGDAPKFPQTSTLDLMLRAYLRSGAAPFAHAATLSLTNMCEGGLYDHLGGGFARYSVDEKWLVPHFEKMLYDNAGLIRVLTLAAKHLGTDLFTQRITETADWALREMQLPDGGFGATYDADSEGVEGKFYVWQPAEIYQALGADNGAVFCDAYDITDIGNFEGHNIPNRLHRLNDFDPAQEAQLNPLRAALFTIREGRIKPGFDDKVLADWNGMMIAALCDAATLLGRADYLAAATQAYDFVMNTMIVEARLYHAWRDGHLSANDTLDDYAQMAWAALCLYRTTADAAYLEDAQTLVTTLNQHFWDADHGGYFMVPDDAKNLITRPRSAIDNAAPSGNGTIVHVLASLHSLTGNDHYKSRAEQTITAFTGELNRSLTGLSTLLSGYEALMRPIQIVIVGDSAAPLIDAARNSLLPDTTIQIIADTAALPANHPAAGKAAQAGQAAAYICIGPQCSLPITDAATLSAKLQPEQIYPRRLLV